MNTKEIFEKNVKELRTENRSWRKALEKYIGKKKEKEDIELLNEVKNDNNNNNNMDIDEEKEYEKYKITNDNKNQNKKDNEVMKLKIIIDNLQTENSLLKYKLSNDNKDNLSTSQNNYIKQNITNEQAYINNNNNLNINGNEQKVLELLNKNKENEEIIKKLQEENKNLKTNVLNKNIDANSPYNFLMEELKTISKVKSELELKLEKVQKERNDNISNYAHINIENEKLKNENSFLRSMNKNLNSDIQKFKFDDLQKSKEESQKLKNKIIELEKDRNEKNERVEEFKKKFNHDYGLSKKIRVILSFLNNNNKMMEAKINEYNLSKEKNEKNKLELQKIINEKNNIINLKDKIIEENKKKLNEEIFKYTQLNIEYSNLLDISKENDININTVDNDIKIKKSFSVLSGTLNKYKEVVPFLNHKLESVEKENKALKDQINKLNMDINYKNNEMIKIKDKEIEELKNDIKRISNEKENLMKESVKMKTENNLMKDDIILIGNSISLGKNNINNKANENDTLLSDLLNQLMKARNIISVLLPEK